MNFRDAMSGKSMHDFATGASPLLMAIGQGLSSGKGAFAYMPQGLAMMEQQHQKKEADKLIGDAFGGDRSPSTPPFVSTRSTPARATPAQAVARDTMTALGKSPGGHWDGLAEVQRGIFAGESNCDYNALFGFSNRSGGQFADVRLTDMTVDQALQFADPSGLYGQHVKGEVGRVATPMGAYQVVGTTLRDAKAGLGLTGSEQMTPELQDKIGRWIYDNQGTGAWEGYRGPVPGAGGAPQQPQLQGGSQQPQLQNGMNLERFVAILQNPQVDPATKQFVMQNYGPQQPQKTPAIEQEIQRYMQVFGASREEATKLAGGLITEYRDPLTGDLGQFDLVTGQPWGGIGGGMQNPDSAVPATGIQPVPAVTTETLEPVQVTPNNTSGGNLDLSQSIPDYGIDPAKAYGVGGVVRGSVNAVGDGLGMGTAFPEAGQIQADVAVLGENMLADIASGYPRQPPSWMLKNIKELTPKAGTLEGIEAQTRKVKALRNSFSTELETLYRQVARKQSPTSKQEIQSKIIAIESAIGRVDAFLQSHQPPSGLSSSDTALIDRWAD